jgi:hypothetical protein
MRTAAALKIDRTQTNIGRDLAKAQAGIILSIEDGNALIQCQVSSAVAAAMLAPLGGDAVGQFRPLAGNLVEIDALVTVPHAIQMLEAHAAATEVRALH